MSNTRFLRVCGIVGLVAGIALVIGGALNGYFELTRTGAEPPFSETAQESTFLWTMLFYGLAVAGLLFALPGFHLAHQERAGRLGLPVHGLAVAGTAGLLGMVAIMALVAPSLAPVAPEFLDNDPTGPLGIAFPVIWIGASLAFVAFGALHAWTAVVNRWAALAFAGGVVLGVAIEPVYYVGDVVHGVGLAWMGFALHQLPARNCVTVGEPASMEVAA